MLRKKSSSSSKPSGFGRFFRSVMSIVILSALVLGITLSVKELYTMDAIKLSILSRTLLARVGLDVDHSQIGQVAGKFVERMSETDLGSGTSSSREEVSTASTVVSARSGEKLKVAILSDIHSDLANLTKALDIAKEKGVKTLIVIGDLTDFGDIENLQKVKNQISGKGFDYFVLPGDHDLADSLDTTNFEEVFGKSYEETTLNGVTFLLINNSANFTEVPASEMSWVKDNIGTADFVIFSQPLFSDTLNPPFNSMYMGSTQNEVTTEELKQKQAEVKDQRNTFLQEIRSATNVKAVIAGDHHKSSTLYDPTNPELKHYVVGAISDTVNEYPQKIIQSSRFSLLTIYEDNTYKIEDILLD